LLLGEDAGGSWSLGVGSAVPVSGGFSPGAGTFRARQQSAGSYFFRYVVPAGAACPADTSQVAVTLFPLPVADAGPDRVLNCLNPIVSIGRGSNPAFRYSWSTTDGNLIDNDMAVVEADAPGRYQLEVIDPITGCRNVDEMRVISDFNVIEPVFSIGQVSCYGADDGFIRLDSISGGTPPLGFSVNGGTFREQTSFSGLAPGNYNITIRDAEGCQTEVRFELVQPVEVQVVLDGVGLSGDFPIIRLGDSLHLQVLTNVPDNEIQSIVWKPAVCDNCREISLLPFYTALYSVTLTNTNGCAATSEIEIGVDRRPDVFVPNVFSPNNDGNNDLLVIYAGKQIAKARRFQVFSRWGEPLFESVDFPLNDPQFGWDGTHRGKPLNPSVFVFYLLVETIDGSLHEFKGDITLIR
jgi:gliding motility-associated-like protein